MSFDWNLSSDDEEDLDEWTRQHGFVGNDVRLLNASADEALPNDVASPPADPTVARAAVVTNSPKQLRDEESSDDEDEEVDWEDAEDDDLNVKPSATTQSSLQAVTIDLNKDPQKNEKKSKKRKRRNKYRLDSMPITIQHLCLQLHRAHVLAGTAHAVHLSYMVAQPEIVAIAHSLFSREWMRSTESCAESPTVSQLEYFFDWYKQLLRNADQRQELQGQGNRATRASQGRQRGRRRQARPLTSMSKQTDSAFLTSTCPRTDLLNFAQYLSSTTTPHDTNNPQTLDETSQQRFRTCWGLHNVLFFVAMTRSLGWRTRLVHAWATIPTELTVEHPLFHSLASLERLLTDHQHEPSQTKKKKQKKGTSKAVEPKKGNKEMQDEESADSASQGMLLWVEILCRDPSSKRKLRWVHVDPVRHWIDRPDLVESQWKCLQSDKALAYATAVEHAVGEQQDDDFVSPTALNRNVRTTDVTPRYAHSWVASLRLRGVVRGKNADLKDAWWSETLKKINGTYVATNQRLPARLKSAGSSQDDAIVLDDSDDDEKMPALKTAPSMDEVESNEAEELKESAGSEAMPTSKAAFKSHPLYVIPSVLNATEVLAPDASKRMVGVFKGELVYRRSDVSTVKTANKWLYKGRRVLEEEVNKPIKRVKARKKPAKGFQALKSYGVGTANDGSEKQRAEDIAKASQPLEDGMENVYAIWQTEAWSPPPVGPTDPIPTNEFKNVELELINPGLVHIDQRGVAPVAKKLGIPYAPCLLGFEGHAGNRTPTIRGIVIHQHNEQLIREANVEVTSHAIEEEYENRRRAIHRKWKKLMVALLTKDRIEREYG